MRLKAFLFFGLNNMRKSIHQPPFSANPQIGYNSPMPKLERKRSITKLTHSPITYIVLLLLGALFSFGAIDAYGKSRMAEKRLSATEAENQRLSKQKDQLSKDLEYANTPFGEEKALREKFNVIREGEKIIVIVPEDQKADIATSLDKREGIFDFFLRFFKK